MHTSCPSRYTGPAARRRGPAIHGAVALALAASFGVSAPLSEAGAAEYTLTPDLRIGAHYNDNIRLREDGEGREEIDVFGGYADLGFLSQWRTEVSSVQLRPRIRTTWYPDNEDEESDDYYLDFAARNEGLRSKWALIGNYAREQVIRGEQTRLDFVDPEFEDPEADETGLLDAQRRRTRWRLAPSFSFEVTERLEAGAGLSYSDVQFSPQLVGEALDYTTARADAFFIRELSELSRFRVTVFASTYEVDAIDNDSTSYGLRGRYERDITEVYDVYVDVGVQRTEVEAGPANEIDDSSTGFLLDAGVRRKWERTEIRLAGGRSIQPSGSGFLRETDRVRLSIKHQFLPRWYGELAGIGQTTDSVDSEVSFNERDYFEIRTLLGYRLAESWNLEASYAFKHQDYEDRLGTAEANEAFLVLSYQPRGRAWSW